MVIIRLTRLSDSASCLFPFSSLPSIYMYLQRTPKFCKEISLLFCDCSFNLLAGSSSLLFNSACDTSSLLLATPMVPAQISVSLCELRAFVDEVAQEEEVVFGLNGEGVPHECRRVDAKREGHVARNTAS